MKTTQPPITNDQELAGYQAGVERLRTMMDRHEGGLLAERQQSPFDPQHLDRILYQLHHLDGYYLDIKRAIEEYLRQRQRTCTTQLDITTGREVALWDSVDPPDLPLWRAAVLGRGECRREGQAAIHGNASVTEMATLFGQRQPPSASHP